VGSVAPLTRFTAMEPVPGWLKVACALAPMSKLRQSMMARLLDWFTVRLVPDWEKVAAPPVTVPPCGRLLASKAWAGPAPKSAEAAPRTKNEDECRRDETRVLLIMTPSEPWLCCN